MQSMEIFYCFSVVSTILRMNGPTIRIQLFHSCQHFSYIHWNTPPTSDKWFNITCKWDRPFALSRLYRQFQCRHILCIYAIMYIWPNMVLSHEITGSRLYIMASLFRSEGLGMGSIMWIHDMNPGNVPAFSILFTCILLVGQTFRYCQPLSFMWMCVKKFVKQYVDVIMELGAGETAGARSILCYVCSCIVFDVVVSHRTALRRRWCLLLCAVHITTPR